MKQNNLALGVSMIVVLMSITGCTFPGRKIQTTPTINPSILATHAARTAEASAQQTEQASIPTPVPPTSTPKISPITGTSLTVLEDQSTIFSDTKAGIQVTIPPGWLAIRPNEDEYYKAFTLDVVLSNPEINDRLTKIQSSNTDFFRLDAIDIRPDHVVDSIISVMSVNFQPDDFRTLEEWTKAESTKKSPFKEYKFLSSIIQKTADGTHVLVVQESWRGSPKGTLYHREILFSLTSGTLVIDIQTNRSIKDTVLPDFEKVINSLTLMNQ
ncbi:MAG TPA: hypothetical protein VN653_08130 [Anaerolineales bacterium]|nr:hypothetical protein [Anaerolineales bacterium]